MTAPVQGFAEYEKIAAQFQAALTKVGIVVIGQALSLWQRVPPNRAKAVREDYLDSAVNMVMAYRRYTRDLAVSFYRLGRALRTGTTIPDPRNPGEKTVSLDQLRADFKRLAAMADKPAEALSEPSEGSTPSPDTRKGVQIPVEALDGITKDGDAEEARIEAEAEKQAREVLATLGPNALARAVDAIDHDRPATEVDNLRDEAHSKTGSRQAAAADRIARNGARSALWSLADRDNRVIGYVRASRTGTPCGWCAMLISRGLVLYRSKQSAEFGSDGDKYHDNCQCYAEPVYSAEDYNNSSRFDLNRKYAELWPKVTKGKRGKAALSAWRRYIRQQQKANPGGVAPDKDNAQEAA